MNVHSPAALLLTQAFRTRYGHLERTVVSSITNEFGDPVVLARIGDDLDVYAKQFEQASCFPWYNIY
jgi:hypothetical protein